MDETIPVIVFPIACSLLSVLCAAVLARDAARRPRPDKIVWSIAFVMFALAARRQLTALYHDVLTWERPGRDDIAEIVASPEPVPTARQA